MPDSMASADSASASEKQQRQENRSTGKRHTFVMAGPYLEFRRVYWDGTPIAAIPYTATLADGSKRKGVTDKTGLARHEKVSPGEASVVYGNDPNRPAASVQMEVDDDFQDLFDVASDEV